MYSRGNVAFNLMFVGNPGAQIDMPHQAANTSSSSDRRLKTMVGENIATLRTVIWNQELKWPLDAGI